MAGLLSFVGGESGRGGGGRRGKTAGTVIGGGEGFGRRRLSRYVSEPYCRLTALKRAPALHSSEPLSVELLSGLTLRLTMENVADAQSVCT